MSSEPLNLKKPLNPEWWYFQGEPYNFDNFVKSHPGGDQAIKLGKGRDTTALFYSYHNKLPSQSLLSKYKINISLYNPITYKYALNISNETFTYNENEFYRNIKLKAEKYFKLNNYSPKGNYIDFILWLINLFILIISTWYCAIYGGKLSSIIAILSGITKSLLVIRSTHAASHYAFSTSPTLNRAVYWINMALLGDTPGQWTAKHVISHHIDTNITPIDDDTMYPMKRVIPSYERAWYHRYQHLYIWLLYFFVYFPWTISHNIKVLYSIIYRCELTENGTPIKIWGIIDYIEIYSCIIVHHLFRLLPFFYLNTWYQAILIALIQEFSASVWFSLQFAVNHEIEETLDLGGDGPNDIFGKKRDFGLHQVMTSHNYSIDKFLALHLSGGLNYQIEHHLFPSVHYKYYPDLSKIVRNELKKYNGVVYNTSDTFWIAVKRHYNALVTFGSNDNVPRKKID